MNFTTCGNHCEHGLCTITKGVINCECDDGWDGFYCNKCIQHENCHFGYCKSIPGECICSRPDYVGKFCDVLINPCKPDNPCENFELNNCLFSPNNHTHYQCCDSEYIDCSTMFARREFEFRKGIDENKSRISVAESVTKRTSSGSLSLCFLLIPVLMLIATVFLVVSNKKIIKKVRGIDTRTRHLEILESGKKELPECSNFLQPPPYQL